MDVTARLRGGRKAEAESYAIEAVAVLENLPPGPELAMAYSNRAQLHMLSDQHQQAVLWGTRAIELAVKLGATETLVHALNNVGTAELISHDEQGRIKLEESLRLALANSFQEHAGRAFTNLADTAVRSRNYHLAMRYLDDGIAYTSEHDMDSLRQWRLQRGTNRRSSPRLRFLRDSQQARRPKDYGTRCAQQGCEAFRAARDRARKKTRSGSQVGKWKCLP